MIPWEFTRKNPVIDLRMLATRQFGSCFVVMLMAGAILLATTQFLPLLVQQNFGYTATWAGLVLSPGGVVTMIMMFIVRTPADLRSAEISDCGGRAHRRGRHVRPDQSIRRCRLSAFFAWSRIYVGIGLPLIFVPVLTASYAGVPPGKTDQASALINAARNIGGSIGVSLERNVLAHREQFHQSRLVENVSRRPAPAYQDALRQGDGLFCHAGQLAQQAQQQAIQWIGQQVQLQASFLAYIDVFWTLMLLGLAIVPLALMLRRRLPVGRAAIASSTRWRHHCSFAERLFHGVVPPTRIERVTSRSTI